jgi:hypothetical protein
MRDRYAEGPSISHSVPDDGMEAGKHNTSAEELLEFNPAFSAETELGDKTKVNNKKLATDKSNFNITENAPGRTGFIREVDSNGFSM